MTTGTDGPRRSWSRVALAVAAWLLAVALGSGLAWVAVTRAGRAVIDPVAAAPGAVADAPSAETGTTPGGSGTAQPTPTAAPEEQPLITSVVPPPSTAPAATPAPQPPPASEPALQPDRHPAPAPAPAPAPQPGPVSGTRSTEGGVLAVTCRDGVVSLSYATPASGWTVQVGDDPGEVRARFRSGEDGERREIEIRASCVDGAPSFAVEED